VVEVWRDAVCLATTPQLIRVRMFGHLVESQAGRSRAPKFTA